MDNHAFDRNESTAGNENNDVQDERTRDEHVNETPTNNEQHEEVVQAIVTPSAPIVESVCKSEENIEKRSRKSEEDIEGSANKNGNSIDDACNFGENIEDDACNVEEDIDEIMTQSHDGIDVYQDAMENTPEDDERAQVIRDRLMRESRWKILKSRTSSHSDVESKARRMEFARALISDLENHGPAGLVHIAAWSYATGTPIRIRTQRDRLDRTIGQNSENQDPVHLEYQENSDAHIGHWTMPGNIEAVHSTEPNNCLFAAIAAQTGRDPEELRAETITHLKRNIKLVADCIDEIIWLEDNYRVLLMLGGARYVGQSPSNARTVIDNSQNSPCYGGGPLGHPRGHASHPGATGPTDSVENYSRSDWKTAFLSRADQDVVAHIALSHQTAQTAMRELNQGAQSRAVTIQAHTLNGRSRLPKGQEFRDGQPSGPARDFTAVTLVLRHHSGKQNDPNADVFVHTFYPRL